MNIKRTKKQINELKQQVKAAKLKRDFRLLKLALVLVILALIAAFMTGRIQLW